MSEVYIRSQNKEKLYRLGGNYACVEYGEYEDIKKKREVVANNVGFGESKAEAEARGQQLPESDGFMNIPEGADEELPFN